MDCVPIGGGGVDATDDGKETIPVPFAGALFGAPEPLNATLDAGLLVSDDKLKKAVADAGYTVTAIK